MIPSGRYLYLEEVAGILGYTPNTLRRYLWEKTTGNRVYSDCVYDALPPMKRVGKRYRIWAGVLQQFVNEKEGL